MEATNVSVCKYILTTYEGSNGSKYYDTTFHLRPPFKPNSNGQYKVQINEALFLNNEATLRKNIDYMNFIITYDDDTTETINFKTIDDYFTYSSLTGEELETFYKILAGTETNYIKQIVPDGLTISITLKDARTNEDLIKNIANLPQHLVFDVMLKHSTKVITNAVMRYSSNYCYILNNLNKEIKPSNFTDLDDGNYEVIFDFYNLRLAGAYIYVLDTPLKSVVNTYNSNNQGFNIVACSYNTNSSHNSLVQMVSSMEVVSNDISHLRIRLLNDQFETVKIYGPIYIQITLSNEG